MDVMDDVRQSEESREIGQRQYIRSCEDDSMDEEDQDEEQDVIVSDML